MSNVIKDREIFAVGTWNGIKFTLADLQQIADNFRKLDHSVPLKLGHNKKQPLTDGQPALGWVQNLRVQGEKLLADFVDVPDIVKRAIMRRRFVQVSIELIREAKFNGSLIRNVLDAVALLGADIPAVKGLKDLDKFVISGERLAFADAQLGEFTSTPGANPMDEKEVQALIERAVQPLSEQITSLTKERDEFKQKAEKLEADNKERDDKTRTDKLEAARKRVDAMFNQAIEAKVILPAQREEYVAAFSLNDEDKLVAMTEDDLKRVAAIVNPDGKKEDKKDEAQTRYFSKPSDVDDKGGSTVELTDKTSDGNLVHLTNKYLAEHPTFLPEDPERYTKALEFIMAENPELAKVYVMGNG